MKMIIKIYVVANKKGDIQDFVTTNEDEYCYLEMEDDEGVLVDFACKAHELKEMCETQNLICEEIEQEFNFKLKEDDSIQYSVDFTKSE